MTGGNNIDRACKIKYLQENLGKSIIPLSAFEESLPGTNPLEVLFFYKKKYPISKLREDLLKTINYYNLFSSRLIMIDPNKFALHYCTDGVAIKVLPFINTDFDDVNIHDIREMMVHVRTLPGEPLFAVTGIPIKDGILAAISCSHAIGDGISLMLFLYAWSCIVEGRSFPLPSPQRLFKGHPVEFDKVDPVFIPPLSELSDRIQRSVNRTENNETYSTREYFSDEFLQEIKNKAKFDNADDSISSNQIIIAWLLKKYHDHLLPNTDKIIIRNPVNLRGVHPDIDPSFIGNAHFDSITEFTKDEVNQMSVYEMAGRLRESITHMRNASYIREIVFLSAYGIDFKADVLKNRPPPDIEADILSSNLTHLNDIESMFLGPHIGSFLYVGLAFYQTAFTILKEKNGRTFAQITSRYPFV